MVCYRSPGHAYSGSSHNSIIFFPAWNAVFPQPPALSLHQHQRSSFQSNFLFLSLFLKNHRCIGSQTKAGNHIWEKCWTIDVGSYSLSGLVLVYNELVEDIFLVHFLAHSFLKKCLDFVFDWYKILWNRLGFNKSIFNLIGILVSIMLCPSLQTSIPLSFIDIFNQIFLLFLANKIRNKGQSFDFFICVDFLHDSIIIIMSEYKQLMKVLFGSWSKTHELSSRIYNAQIRRNQFKKL